MKKSRFDIFQNQVTYELFFNENYSPLCRFAYTYLKDAEHADDVVQECFVKLWERRESLDITTSIKSYLYSAVRNTCLNELKHAKVKANYQQHIKANSTSVSNLEEEIEANELKDKINIAIAQMPDQRRKIFRMSRFEGLKYSEIADKLSLSPKTVANHMGLAIKYLKTELKEYLHIGFVIFLLDGLGDLLN